MFINKKRCLTNNVLYDIYFKNSEYVDVSALLQNSTIQNLLINIFGRCNYGEGALSLAVFEVKKMLVLNPARFNIDVSKYDVLIKRPLGSIFEECGINPKLNIPIQEQEPKPLLDRAELDKIVFDSLDLTVDERKDVYRAVCRLVWNRISKARSV